MHRNHRLHILFAVLISLIVYCLFFVVSLRHSLAGHFDEYLQQGGEYASPSNVRVHGFEAKLFPSKSHSGWDGQFYYYQANDPLLLSDTVAHIDMPRYRAQRVGVPVIAYATSKLLGQEWVSPGLYWLVNVALMLMAVAIFSWYCASKGYSAYWPLLWSLSAAPLFTVLFGFVDGSADALCILAMICLLQRRMRSYVLLATLTVLSRETYALLPAMLGLGALVDHLLSRPKKSAADKQSLAFFFKLLAPHAIPILILLTWEAYINIRLYRVSDLILDGMLGLPFASTLQYISTSLSGAPTSQLLTHTGRILTLSVRPYELAIGLLLFLTLLLRTGAYASAELKQTWQQRRRPMITVETGLLLYLSALVLLYLCLGPRQVWEPVGFIKALSMVPAVYLLLCISRKQPVSLVFTFVGASFVVYCMSTLHQRVSLPINTAPETPPHWVSSQPSCISKPDATILLLSLQSSTSDDTLARWLMPKTMKAMVRVENHADVPLEPFDGPHTVNLAYLWLKPDGKTVIAEGARAPLPHALGKDESADVSLMITTPERRGDKLVRITLVQEGCAWLNQLNPSIAWDAAEP